MFGLDHSVVASSRASPKDILLIFIAMYFLPVGLPVHGTVRTARKISLASLKLCFAAVIRPGGWLRSLQASSEVTITPGGVPCIYQLSSGHLDSHC